ncbi:bacteriorhodopsin [Spirosoma spitsbergense]|uniref:bacteriorhodopsin n=1 Tax=Spirosoma spitsbergense TaxID=431554 RepID=UPI000365EC06|nr:bacteriorhodopsin [Spirosoma spitsbergense]
MEIADSFIPTAGAVGLLPMVTYFFMVVAMFISLGIFITAITQNRSQPSNLTVHPQQLVPTLLAVVSASTGLVYYLIQLHYHDLLAEFPTVSDATDRQTLIRESYNAIGQYRYVAWFMTAPLLLLLVIAPLRLPWESSKRLLTGLLAAALLMVFTGYIGHQQVSFDNEIQPGPKLGWGSISLVCYGYISITLYRRWKASGQAQGHFRTMALLFVGSWGIYLLGYGLTVLPIDFNWLHITYTITDVTSQIGIGLISYVTWSDSKSMTLAK